MKPRSIACRQMRPVTVRSGPVRSFPLLSFAAPDAMTCPHLPALVCFARALSAAMRCGSTKATSPLPLSSWPQQSTKALLDPTPKEDRVSLRDRAAWDALAPWRRTDGYWLLEQSHSGGETPWHYRLVQQERVLLIVPDGAVRLACAVGNAAHWRARQTRSRPKRTALLS